MKFYSFLKLVKSQRLYKFKVKKTVEKVQQEEESLKPFQGLRLAAGVSTVEKVQQEEEPLKHFQGVQKQLLFYYYFLRVFSPAPKGETTPVG